MRKYHNQFAKQICNITVKKPPSKINQKLAKQIAKNSHYSQHQPRIHTEPSPKNSFSKEQYEGFQSFLEINQIEETEEDENININLDSKDLQHKLSVSFYAKEERRKSQFEPIESCNPIYQPLMCKQKPVAHLEFQQFMTNSNQEYYLLNNASNQLLKTSSVKASKNSNQLTSATTTLGKSSHQNISVSKFEKNPEKKTHKQLQNLKATAKQPEKLFKSKGQYQKRPINSQQHKTARRNNFANYLAKFSQNIPETYTTNPNKMSLEKKDSKINEKSKNFSKKFSYLRTPKFHFYGRADEAALCMKPKEKASVLKF